MLTLLVVLACAPTARVSVSPQAWRERLEQARPGEHDALLGELHLAHVTDARWAPPTLEQVEVRSADLGDATRDELIVRAVFTTVLKEERPTFSRDVRLYRLQVLQHDGKGWCSLDASMSRDDVLETPNAGPADGMKDTLGPLTMELVHLSHPKHFAVQLSQPHGTIARHTSSGERREWWELIGGRMVKVLSLSDSSGTNRFAESALWKAWYELRGKPPVQPVRFLETCDAARKDCDTESHVFTRSDAGIYLEQ